MHYLPEISLLFNFFVLLAALIFLSRKPFKTYIRDRSETIRLNVEESEKLQQEALQLLKNYQTKLSKLDSEIHILFTEAKKEGEKEKIAILARAEKMSQQIIENAKNSAAREIEKQKLKLEKELLSKVIAEALAALKQKSSEKDHQQFTENFIEQMEKHGHN